MHRAYIAHTSSTFTYANRLLSVWFQDYTSPHLPSLPSPTPLTRVDITEQHPPARARTCACIRVMRSRGATGGVMCVRTGGRFGFALSQIALAPENAKIEYRSSPSHRSHIQTYVHTRTYTYHRHTYTHTHIHTHTYTHTHNTYTHIHTHIHTYTYTYTHTHIHIHTYTHTYTHIHLSHTPRTELIKGAQPSDEILTVTQYHQQLLCVPGVERHIHIIITSHHHIVSYHIVSSSM